MNNYQTVPDDLECFGDEYFRTLGDLQQGREDLRRRKEAAAMYNASTAYFALQLSDISKRLDSIAMRMPRNGHSADTH